MALVGERKALAAAVLAFYALVYLINAIALPGDELRPLFGALAGLYGLAFLSVVAGYFWARWFAIGVGLYGVIGAIMAIVQIGLDYTFLFYGGTHAVVSLFLWGNRMAQGYDGRSEWRERFHLDEFATRRLGKAVIRIGITLPILIIYGLAPRDGALDALVALAVVGFAGLGVAGVLRMRTWGVLVLALSAIAVAFTAVTTASFAGIGWGVGVQLPETGALAAVALIACTLPFAAPMARYLRAP